MSKLSFENYEIISANLGEENLMPDIKNVEYIHAGFALGPNFPEGEGTNLGKGMINTIIPYTLQDNYDRERKPHNFKAAILENSKLKAVFLPELGGRLWSLYDKVNKRELLYVNPVFQPGNLAIRNAWFSGGVEWNIAIKGHNPLTCCPLYAASLKTADGEPVLRMYEYERIRGIVYSIDFMLPEDSEVLYVKTTVENTCKDDKYMYWWSNIAVPEYRGTRVISPCDDSLICYYDENQYLIDGVDVPYPSKDAPDLSYAFNAKRSQDYFFRIPENKDKWIAAINDDGYGLLQFSTKELWGRKVFLWGQGKGGKNWSRWLSGDPQPYIEIQAGLARTQYEHITMPGSSTITWMEGYTAAMLKSSDVHGDWHKAIDTVQAEYDKKSVAFLDMEEKFNSAVVEKIEQYGSAWGYLENLSRNVKNEVSLSERLEFPKDAVTVKEEPWLKLLETGVMEDSDLSNPPLSFEAGPFWQNLLENQVASGKGNATAYLQLGVIRYAAGDIDGAYEAFVKSNEFKENAWAYRNIAMIEKNEYGNDDKALEFIRKAVSFNKTYRGLLVNVATTMLGAKVYEEWIALFDSLNETLRNDGRLKIYTAMAYMEIGDYDSAKAIVNPDFIIYDLKEGELSLSYVWRDLYKRIIKRETGITDEETLTKLQEEQYPLPEYLDFRMHE